MVPGVLSCSIVLYSINTQREDRDSRVVSLRLLVKKSTTSAFTYVLVCFQRVTVINAKNQ